MIADIYWHTERIGREVQLLSHDIDVDGVDLTLVYDGSVVPLQLKSRIARSTTNEWSVRRRIPLPLSRSALHEVLFSSDEPSNEGLGGAFVVQQMAPLTDERYPRLWYRIAQLHLVFLRNEKRFTRLVKECDHCPRTLSWRSGDLTPPLTVGELLWFLLELDASSQVIGDAPGLTTLLVSNPASPEKARDHLRAIEQRAWTRWRGLNRNA